MLPTTSPAVRVWARKPSQKLVAQFGSIENLLEPYRPTERRTKKRSGNQPGDDCLLQIPCHHQNRCSHPARHGSARPEEPNEEELRRFSRLEFHTLIDRVLKPKRQFVLPPQPLRYPTSLPGLLFAQPQTSNPENSAPFKAICLQILRARTAF